MEIQETSGESGTNCLECERYKTLGEVCVIEHGKKFLWEFCRDFQPEVKLPEYDELMRTVRKDIALQRVKEKQKKKRERALKQKELEQRRHAGELKRRAAKRKMNSASSKSVKANENSKKKGHPDIEKKSPEDRNDIKQAIQLGPDPKRKVRNYSTRHVSSK
ncbi:MAG TPA: hypothetical protein VJN71_03340 [Nitrososphaerales archaeon]|nr:hypothetical protein [Nitrososphaerales archaeon]